MKGDNVKHTILRCTLAGTALAALTACGGDSRTWYPVLPEAANSPTVTVDDLGTGAWTVSSGDANKPTMGRYYAAANGKRLLAQEDDPIERVNLLLRRADASSKWAAIPVPTSDLAVSFLRTEARRLPTPDATALAGRYVVRLSDGGAADFLIGSDGRITAGNLPGCRLSGALTASSLPSTLSLNLDSNGCAGLPAHASGVLIADPQDAPANLRLLADDGSRTVDLRGYAEPAT
ncbi:hypothetical protein WKW79_04825 [Variovorax robiniae]|uniref:Lipoprotein n=1 Tax=Variovorax robiniae TaxID=1836199 RepID=A0ABU8X254_9BURK